MKAQHTPGPWEWRQSRGNNIYEHRVLTQHTIIADLNGENPDEVRANARLIAAAPELLGACATMVRLADHNPQIERIVRMLNVRNVVSKATGEE